MTLLNRLLFCYLLLVGSSVELHAGVTVSGGYTDASGQTLRKVHGYMNETTDITITLTLNNDGVSDAGVYDADTNPAGRASRSFMVVAAYSSDNTFSAGDYTNNMWLDADHAGNSVGPFMTLGGGDGDNTGTFTVTGVQIRNDNSHGAGEWFDLKVGFTTLPNGNADLDGDGLPNTLYDVDWEDGGVTKTNLISDNTDPSFSSFSYPASNTDFNTVKYTYNLAEDLSATYTSQIKFLGTAGTDNGNSKVYNLSGGDLSTGSQTVSSLGITLVEGSTYSIQYILYDLAGNVTNNGSYASVRTGAVYDVTAPTV
ncbi:uncharacterized protein METZ01_LOCUS233770, partial [marine metagenome]